VAFEEWNACSGIEGSHHLLVVATLLFLKACFGKHAFWYMLWNICSGTHAFVLQYS